MPKLPEDPLLALERNLLRTTRRLGMLVGSAVQARLKETVEVRRVLGDPQDVNEQSIDLIRMRQEGVVSSDAIIGEPLQMMALIKAYEAYRKTVIEIEQLRLARRKQAVAERQALAKLPQIGDEEVAREVERVVSEHLGRMSAVELRQIADERAAEERQAREVEARGTGDPIPTLSVGDEWEPTK